MFNRLSIKKCDSAMDEDLNPKMEVTSSNPCSYNLRYLNQLAKVTNLV
jgi:hypothetical protein